VVAVVEVGITQVAQCKVRAVPVVAVLVQLEREHHLLPVLLAQLTLVAAEAEAVRVEELLLS
tara:strand:+ start:393 stop:578 length:186 start_codon:yes stop_codon:yes gene_type:complete